jgi:methylisocitrate lyase
MLTNNSKQQKSLKLLMKDEQVVYAPGVWDGISAILSEREGFSALCASGFAISASLGLPDAELYSMSENLNAVKVIKASSTLPVICDIDTGYGNAINVIRTIQEFEKAGASAVFMEDQLAPKRCPLCVGEPVPLISLEEATGKIRAAFDSRQSDLIIIARTDASGEDAFKRAEAYVKAGADMIMPVTKTFSTIKEWEKCHSLVGVPLLATLTSGTWVEKEFTQDVMVQIGVKIALLPLQILYAGVTGMINCLHQLRSGVKPHEITSKIFQNHDFSELIGFKQIEDLQSKYLPK